jgi:hypothetical protein
MTSLADKNTSGTFSAGVDEVELISARTRGFKKFSLPDAPSGLKRYRVGGQIGPIHYREDPFSTTEEFKEIDLETNLTPSESWDAACETNGFQVRFWQNRLVSGKTVRYIAQYRRAGKWLAMAPLVLAWENDIGERQIISKALAVGAPVINNDAYQITWSDVFGTGIHFRYNLRPDEFFKTVIIDNKTDLPLPTIGLSGLKLTIVLALAWHSDSKADNGFSDSITTSDLPDDSIDIDNPDEELVDADKFSFKDVLLRDTWWMQKPKAWDSAEERHSIDIEWRLRRKNNSIFGLFSVPASSLNHVALV